VEVQEYGAPNVRTSERAKSFGMKISQKEISLTKIFLTCNGGKGRENVTPAGHISILTKLAVSQ